MIIVVTGGGGYLGSTLVPQLVARGHGVRVYDRFCFGEDGLAPVRSSGAVTVFSGDIRRLQEHPELLEGANAVIHLAALANDPSCDLDEEMTLDVNVESTRELASRAVHSGVNRFVFASSCSVYGHGVFDVLDELSPANPVSSFAASKLAGEREVLGLGGASFEPVVARLASLYGVSPRMRFDVAVNQMAARAQREGSINILGGGRQWRPFLHVADAARALCELVEAPSGAVAGEVLNVGDDGGNLRIGDLAERVARRFDDVELAVAPDDEDRRNYRVSFQRIHERLGFAAERTIEDGIDEVKALVENPAFDPFVEAYFNVRRMRALRATPVDEGGEPIAPRFIPLARPNLGPEEEEAVVSALRSGWLASGPHVPSYEKAFGQIVGAEHVVAVNSCTAALHLCLVQAGVGPGDEVITSPITWASTGNTIVNMGAKVVFADIDPGTLNIDPAAVAKAITAKTKAIMPVHLAGQACDLDALYALGKKHGIPIVEDAAHALGTSYKGTPIGGQGDFACFSFYPTKNITTIEGGTIALRDGDVAKRLRTLAANGLKVTAWDRYGRSALAAPPEVQEPGYKYLMGNVSAAMGVQQLKKFRAIQESRIRLAGLYGRALREVEEVTLPEVADPAGHAWHLMIVRIDSARLAKSRDEIAYALRRENVGTGYHFYGLHLHRYYREVHGWQPEHLPHATKASSEIISLPLYPDMTDKNVHDIVAAIKKVLRHASK